MDNETIMAEDLTDKSVDTDIDSQRRSQRERELQNWDKQQAQDIANKEGVELTDAHFNVIECLRDHYLNHGEVESGRQLDEMLDEAFSDQGGRKYLHRLFPEGPVTQGMRFAGLDVPAYSEDAGFGTAR